MKSCLFYKQYICSVGDPLQWMQSLRNAVFFKSQNPRKAGTLCTIGLNPKKAQAFLTWHMWETTFTPLSYTLWNELSRWDLIHHTCFVYNSLETRVSLFRGKGNHVWANRQTFEHILAKDLGWPLIWPT